MRRLLSILLLAVFGLGFASPLLAMTKADAGVPACCRRTGQHQCGMVGAERGKVDASPSLRAPREVCPYGQQSGVVVHPVMLGLPVVAMTFQPVAAALKSAAQMESWRRISRDRSRQKRGPPSVSLL